MPVRIISHCSLMEDNTHCPQVTLCDSVTVRTFEPAGMVTVKPRKTWSRSGRYFIHKLTNDNVPECGQLPEVLSCLLSE